MSFAYYLPYQYTNHSRISLFFFFSTMTNDRLGKNILKNTKVEYIRSHHCALPEYLDRIFRLKPVKCCPTIHCSPPQDIIPPLAITNNVH